MDWEALARQAASVVTALAPVVETLDPALAPAIAIGVKVVQGAIAAEPTAVALYEQIKSGTPPTQTQLQQFEAAYEDSYQQLQADIRAKLAEE